MVQENTVIGNKIGSIKKTLVRVGDRRKVGVGWPGDDVRVCSPPARGSQAAEGSLHAWNSPALGSSQISAVYKVWE